jgi:hypothetical protein
MFSVSPIDSFEPFLEQELVRLERELTSTIALSVDGSATAPVTLSSFFKTASCNLGVYVGLNARQIDYVSQICAFRSVTGYDPLRSYLFRVRGIFKDVPIEINSALQYYDLAGEMAKTRQGVFDAISAIHDLHFFMYETVTSAKVQQMQVNIDQLRSRRDALLLSLKEQADKLGPPGQSTFNQVAKNFSAVFKDILDEQWGDAGEQLFDGFKGIASIIGVNRSPPDPGDTFFEDVGIGQSLVVLQSFISNIIEVQKQMSDAEMANLSNVIDARDRLAQVRAAVHSRFDAVIRASLQEYLLTTDLEALGKNIRTIQDSFEPNKVWGGGLNISSLHDLCRRNQNPIALADLKGVAGCIEFPDAIPNHKGAYAVLSKGPPSNNLPLLIVAGRRAVKGMDTAVRGVSRGA